MARPNPRLAAGVGVLTAVLLFGGSGAQAFGHPGDRGDRGDRGTSSSERGCCRGGSDRDDDRGYGRGRGDNSADRPGHGGNTRKPGNTGRPGNGRNDGDSVTQDDRQIPPLQQGSARVGTQRLAPADDAGDRDDSDDESDARRESGSSGGSARAGDTAPAFKPPRVTVGNGRSPGIRERDREPRGGDYSAPDPAPAPQPPAPPPPAPKPPASIVERIATPPVLSKQLRVAPASDWHGPLWGIAGLLLIPAAGAALGYRQARAAHDAERLRAR